MPDYTLAPTEQGIRGAHLYAQIPSLLTLTGEGTLVLRNDGPTPLTVTPYLGAPLVDRTPYATPHQAGPPTEAPPVVTPHLPTPTTLPSGDTVTLQPDTYAVICNTNGRFTITRT